MRWNETRCVLEGIDPFAITRRDITHPVYVRFNEWSPGKRNVTGYTPWTYIFMLPFALLPKAFAAATYTLLELGCVLFLFRFAWQHAKQHGLDESKAAMASCSLCLLVYPITSAFGVGNFGIPFAATIVIMAWLLDKRHDFLAGACWAFLMCKPQIGLLFTIPVLLHRRWKTLVSAVGICLAMTAIIAAWLQESPIHLLLEVARDGDVGTYSTDLLPLSLFRMATRHVPKGTVLALHALIGGGACLFCSWRMRNCPDWIMRLLPPSFFCSVWLYGWPHDKCVYAIVVIVLMSFSLHLKTSATMRSLFLVVSALCGASIIGVFLPGASEHPLIKLVNRHLFGLSYYVKDSVGIQECLLCLCSATKTAIVFYLLAFYFPQQNPLARPISSINSKTVPLP